MPSTGKPENWSGKRYSRIHEILFHPYTQRLVMFDYSEGLGVWDMKSEQLGWYLEPIVE